VVVAKCGGIDFDARDGKPVRLIIMILTGDNQSQHDLRATPANCSVARKQWTEQSMRELLWNWSRR